MIVAWLRFDGDGGFELVESMSWIPSIGVSYRVGVDGLPLPLAATSAPLFLVAVASTADLRGRTRPYSAAVLLLEATSLGLFLALDLLLFSVFFALVLAGIYFINS